MENSRDINIEKIFVVDDNTGLLGLIQKSLSREGFETEAILTGTQAISRILEDPPCMVLLDYCLPDMTGGEVIEALNDKNIKVPFIIITGHGDENVAVKMMKFGAIDYLVKDTSFLNLLPSVVTKAFTRIETEKRLLKVETDLRESKGQVRKLLLAIEQSPVSIVITDLDGRIEYTNPKFSEVTGYAVEEVIGQNPRILKSKEHDSAFYKELWDTITSGNVWSGEILNKKKNGELFWENASISPIKDFDGNVTHYVSVKEDISIRKEVEKELMVHQVHLMELVEERTFELQSSYERLEREIAVRKKEEKQRKMMALFAELNPSPVLRFNIHGEVLMANPAAVEILKMNSMSGQQLTSIIPGIAKDDITACIHNGSIFSHTVQITDSVFHFIIRGIPAQSIGQIYGSDISEQKKAETETLRARHLASIGELAAGVAHEINNPINGIINYAQILVNKTTAGSREDDIARRIIKESDRIAGIIKSLLSFASDSKEEKHPVNIQGIMSDTLALTEAQLISDKIKLRINIPPELPYVIAQPQQIEQVFLNLLSNARYALNQKYPEPDDNKVLEIVAQKAIIDGAPYMRISFCDHGPGIPENIFDKIMNPFFTTKPSDLGTGLGLSISHGIISDHGGRIEVKSIDGEYTEIVLMLPASKEGYSNEI